MASAQSAGFQMPSAPTPILCRRCRKLDFYQSGLSVSFPIPASGKLLAECELCELFLGMCTAHGISAGTSVVFKSRGSTLEITDSNERLPVLSLLRCPKKSIESDFQMGLPPGPKPFDGILPTLLINWLQDCDKSDAHERCRSGKPATRLPTRLIDVGSKSSPSIRLVRTRDDRLAPATRYLALSHPWGDTKKFEPFCTYKTNQQQEGHSEACFMEGIDYNRLPATFQHAIDVTRRLEVKYLWIDSICILQGEDGDFKDEARFMENVFSGAYCVIGASAATSQRSGFLGKRDECKYVRFEPQHTKRAPLYICEGIDHFRRDVLGSHLSSRGWVLQERALARRTIFFTKTQVYFECGEGVRCETLTKMENQLDGLVGDPNFPHKAVSGDSKGNKIEYFQKLFIDYSNLNFTRETDRPIAMRGLEERLQKGYKSNGHFGIFGDAGNGGGSGFFRRSVLWRYGDLAKRLTKIEFNSESVPPVPSWSWMAYNGPIDYLDVPFGETDWADDFLTPWPTIQDSATPTEVASVGIQVKTWPYRVGGGRKPKYHFYFDLDLERHSIQDENRRYGRDDPGYREYRCVVVGWKKSSGEKADKDHYVLLVTPKAGGEDGQERLFERVGVAHMLGSHILWSNGCVEGKLV